LSHVSSPRHIRVRSGLSSRPRFSTVVLAFILSLLSKYSLSCEALCLSVFSIVFLTRLCLSGTYNRLVTLDQNVNKKWGDVQTVYQRRADLIPNLVNTVQGAANFEKSTIVEVTNARASVGRVQLDPSKAPTDAAQLEQFQAAQG